MKIVLDTNVILVSISDTSPYHWVWKSLEKGEFTLCVTTDIMNEYAEVIERHLGIEAMETTLHAISKHRFVELVTKYYHWNLITNDPDDNKFVDCAIACNADFLVTEDKHFGVLKTVSFPSVKVLDIALFKKELQLQIDG
ncbi:MAG: putative toxin-antitoxin system toxin component, PIN family [Saprospiraceae bacterium]|nr:putative toxin-antitoxin system toxin component, PIN family [Saprospiraceae bacterium]